MVRHTDGEALNDPAHTEGIDVDYSRQGTSAAFGDWCG
jgi:hypothetical protein